MYTAVVLTDESHNKLVRLFSHMWGDEEGWKVYSHHMTMHMGEATEDEQDRIGEFVSLAADAVGGNDKVKAVRVIPWGVETKNEVPHITLAVNKDAGGKPVMSNYIEKWEPLDSPVHLRGRIEQVST